MEIDTRFVPVETITLPLNILPASVKTALATGAQEHYTKTKAARDTFEARVKQKADQSLGGSQVPSDAHMQAVRAEDPDLYRDYQGHHYALKMGPVLDGPEEGRKVTLLRSLITPDVQMQIEAKLTEIEKSGKPLHPWTVQARERLATMTPWSDAAPAAPAAKGKP